ncbi:uncharacterized protein LOC144654283 isoform X1 [Oculina patagonica]
MTIESQIFTAILMLIASANTAAAGAENSEHKEVYVSKTGDDSESCGQRSTPCKTIGQAVRQVDWNGYIFIDGKDTEKNPYDCQPAIVNESHAGIQVQKSLHMVGIESTPHISCSGGLKFLSNTQALRIVLSGIVFRQTPLSFRDCHLLKILNCSFINTSTALTVRMRNNTGMQLDIQSFSYFENNTSCLEVFVLNGVKNRDQSLTVNVSDTKFQNNGLLTDRLARGAITIKSDKGENTNIAHVQISCFKIAYINNHGSFINLDLPTGSTSEEYVDVTLKNNSVSRLISSSRRNNLYTSRAGKTRAQFSNFRCSHNQLLRCIKIVSDKAVVTIRNSSFLNQTITNDKGAAVFLESKTSATLVLVKSRFRRNRATGGGALFVQSKNGIIKVNISFVNFTECTAKSYGSAILVGNPKSHARKNGSRTNKVTANLKEVKVQKFYSYGKEIYSVHIMLSNGKVIINNSSWSSIQNSSTYALTVQNTGGKTNITISGCTFNRGGAVRIMATSKKVAGSVIVENSVMSNQHNRIRSSLYLSPKFKIKVFNILFESIFGTGLGIFPWSWLHYTIPVDIYIYNCTFINNTYDIVVNLSDPPEVKFVINNTNFSSRKAEHRNFGIYFNVKLFKTVSSNAVIKLDNISFDSRPSNIFVLQFLGKKTFTIQRSKFRNGISFRPYVSRSTSMYTIGTGAISIVTNPDKLQKTGCINRQTNEDIHSLWNYDSDVIFEDVLFEVNAGLIAGAVYISNGNVTFNRCTFRNNFATERSGHVYSAYGTGRVVFKDCSFSTSVENMSVNDTNFDKSTFLYSESGGPILFQNTSMVSDKAERTRYAVIDISSGGYVTMDNRTTIECRQGSQLLFENYTHFAYSEKNCSSCRINVTVLKYSCRLCPPGLYSLQKGVSQGFNVRGSFNCSPCPYGANCIENNIASKANFWGYPISNNLSFFACPEHYCQSPASNSKEYNSCHGNRAGFLCGKCAPGYSETMFSTECHKSTECNNHMLWIITIMLTSAFTLYLLIKPPIFSLLRRQILWFRKTKDSFVIRDLGQVHQHSDRGYLKITFYFYQAAELLIVGSTEHLLRKIPFIFSMFAAFNFQVKTFNRAIDCPLAGLTAVSKELLLSVTVFLTMAELVVIYCLNCVFNKIRRKEGPSLIHYIAVFIELLLLGYERLAETALKLLHCVPIGSKSRLFIDGEVFCWQWWQYILLAYLVVFLVPFIIVLYCGSFMLFKASITAWEFLGACILPLPFLVYWFLKRFLQKRENNSVNAQANNKDVLEILHGPFRQPNSDDTGTLYWESILIGRRFVLLACLAFITNSMFRMVCMTITCVLILLHHILMNPYHDPIANKAEAFSLLTLVSMAIINLTKATLISFGTSIDGPTRPYLETLEWAEVCALAFVPSLLSIFLVFAIFSQMVRLLFSLAKKIYRCLQWHSYRISFYFARQQERPLLDISEEDGS